MLQDYCSSLSSLPPSQCLVWLHFTLGIIGDWHSFHYCDHEAPLKRFKYHCTWSPGPSHSVILFFPLGRKALIKTHLKSAIFSIFKAAELLCCITHYTFFLTPKGLRETFLISQDMRCQCASTDIQSSVGSLPLLLPVKIYHLTSPAAVLLCSVKVNIPLYIFLNYWQGACILALRRE